MLCVCLGELDGYECVIGCRSLLKHLFRLSVFED